MLQSIDPLKLVKRPRLPNAAPNLIQVLLCTDPARVLFEAHFLMEIFRDVNQMVLVGLVRCFCGCVMQKLDILVATFCRYLFEKIHRQVDSLIHTSSRDLRCWTSPPQEVTLGNECKNVRQASKKKTTRPPKSSVFSGNTSENGLQPAFWWSLWRHIHTSAYTNVFVWMPAASVESNVILVTPTVEQSSNTCVVHPNPRLTTKLPPHLSLHLRNLLLSVPFLMWNRGDSRHSGHKPAAQWLFFVGGKAFSDGFLNFRGTKHLIPPTKNQRALGGYDLNKLRPSKFPLVSNQKQINLRGLEGHHVMAWSLGSKISTDVVMYIQYRLAFQSSMYLRLNNFQP